MARTTKDGISTVSSKRTKKKENHLHIHINRQNHIVEHIKKKPQVQIYKPKALVHFLHYTIKFSL